MNSNFKEACEACRKDCFGVNKCPDSFNKSKCMFDLRQAEIESSMTNLKKGEKELVLKNMIFNELQKKKIISTNDRVVLQYDERFLDGPKTVQLALCEDCFWALYNRNSCKRTYEHWKFSLKKNIAFDRDAAILKLG